MFTIHRDSPAGEALASALADPNTYKVSFAARGSEPEEAHGYLADAEVSLKVNEGMWSAPLTTCYQTQVGCATCGNVACTCGPYSDPDNQKG